MKQKEPSMSRQAQARCKATEVLGAEPSVFEQPFTVLASPAWRGIEGDIWRAGLDDARIILKHYHPDTAFYVDVDAAISAAVQAGALGVGPKVLQHWQGEGILAFDHLAAPWRVGGLHDATDLDTRSRVIAQKKAFQAGATLKTSTSIFDELERLYAIVTESQIFAHRDLVPFMALFRDAQQKLRALGMDQRPCHRDGNTANIMVNPQTGAVKLVDFDLAANCDPFEDIGCHLIEYFDLEAQARGGFEEWHGSFNEGLFQRAMLYGMADDMRWGLIGAIMAARSARTALEFSKYAAWRFIRLERQAKRSDANARVLSAA
jgi:thiamine kinase-like enzyme